MLQLTETGRRHDPRLDEVERRFCDIARRISDTRAAIEPMPKAGRFTHFGTQIDERIAELADRLAAAERPHG